MQSGLGRRRDAPPKLKHYFRDVGRKLEIFYSKSKPRSLCFAVLVLKLNEVDKHRVFAWLFRSRYFSFLCAFVLEGRELGCEISVGAVITKSPDHKCGHKYGFTAGHHI